MCVGVPELANRRGSRGERGRARGGGAAGGARRAMQKSGPASPTRRAFGEDRGDRGLRGQHTVQYSTVLLVVWVVTMIHLVYLLGVAVGFSLSFSRGFRIRRMASHTPVAEIDLSGMPLDEYFMENCKIDHSLSVSRPDATLVVSGKHPARHGHRLVPDRDRSPGRNCR